MSAFKTEGVWRKNEPNGTARYFKCKLNQAMDNANVKPTQLAAFLGVSPSLVTIWRQGREIPPSDKQEVIALYLGCNNRADIWQFRSKILYDKIARLNNLHKLINEAETEIKEELGKNE